MRGDADIEPIGALIGDPTRARVLMALTDGRALPASRLAAEAGVAPSRSASTWPRCWPLMLRTGWVVVRRMTRVSPSVNSTARVVSETRTVRVWCLWMRPRTMFCPTTMITPVLLARRWTRISSAHGHGGTPAGRAPRRSLTCSGVAICRVSLV